MQVSVIIPTYNHSSYVLQTLDSVFAQTYTDYEIIVVNDGSPDDTAQVLAPLVAEGKIRYIEQPNAGQAAARNRGLALAQGEFIAFLDDDDLWPPDKLEWQVEALKSEADVVFVSGAMELIDGEGETIDERHYTLRYYNAGPVTFESLFRGNPFVSPGQVLIRAAPLHECGGLDEALWGVDDFDLWFRLSRRGRIVNSPRLGLLYRLHASNASRNIDRMYINALTMMERQLAAAPRSKRAILSRIVHRWLYSYKVTQAIMKLRVNKSEAVAEVWRELPAMLYFARPMLRDRVLLSLFVRDLTPRKLQRILRLIESNARSKSIFDKP